MPELLAELVARISADATELRKALTDAEGQTEQSSKRMAESLKKVSMVMVGAGAAVTAAMGFMGKAAIDEEINIKRLAVSLKNVGVNYDDVKDSLEGVIAATQRKTGIADNEQRDALNELITVTGDYDTAIKWLPASLDMAAAKQMDATSAARLLGRAAIGSTEMLTRYGIIIEKDATAAEILTEVQKKFGGAAEATANPLDVLKVKMDDLGETIGAFLVPTITALVDRIVNIITKIQDWIKEHPALTEALVKATAAMGLLTLAIFSAILIIPKLIAMWATFHAVVNLSTIAMIAHRVALAASVVAIQAVTAAQWLWNVAMLANPIGLIILAIGWLIGTIVFLVLQWDSVTNAFRIAFDNIKNWATFAFDVVADKISSVVNWVLTLWGQLQAFWNWLTGFGKGVGTTKAAVEPWVHPGVAEAEWERLHPEEVAQRGRFWEGGGGGGGGELPGAMPEPLLFQRGGIVTKPTLGFLGEAGAEAIIPLDEARLGNITINFTQPVFFDREDTMNKFVDMIRKGIQRQDRLRYGGAYSG